MTYSQILLSASQEQRRLAWEYRKDGKLPEFKFLWGKATRNLHRAKQEREIERQWTSGVAA